MKFPRILLGVSLSAILFAVGGAVGLASAATGSGCPTSIKNLKQANNVSATFSNSVLTTTYTFISLVNENPVGGVPGLVKYCVYPTPAGAPKSGTVTATGANGAKWNFVTDPKDFAFVRPAGDKSNIPLDGKTTVMGTATWSSLPTNQTIVLHINDPAVCSSLYGSTSPYTCFVKPTSALACDNGDTTAAYNAMPFGVEHCTKSTLGFEATATNEFGDEVALAGTARKITSLNVEFNSFGCSVSGHWNTGDCVTNPGDTFTVPITAKIYTGDTTTTGGVAPGTLVATVTQDQTIPFRPSASASCTGTNAGKWFDPLFNGGVGGCVNSLSKVLTFTFAGITIPDNVVWTVAFNTSHSGYNPILCANPGCLGATLNLSPPACNSSAGGCGYDSLNVGVQSYVGAPYAGTDVDEDIAFRSFWDPSYPPPFSSGTLQSLQSETGWTGLRPLGEVITTP